METTATATFSATLSPQARRLAARLEGFGDIVFGFAVSQCALQLPTIRGHVELAHPLALLLYFATFAILASLWMIFHRLISGTFVPAGIDLFAAFAYLAFVSLMPYAMYGISHTLTSAAAARAAFAEYAALYGATTALAGALTYRNLRRGWSYADGAERDRVWLVLLRRCVLCALMTLACGVDLAAGPAAGGFLLFSIPVVMRLMRLGFGRAPSAAALRIPPHAGGQVREA